MSLNKKLVRLIKQSTEKIHNDRDDTILSAMADAAESNRSVQASTSHFYLRSLIMKTTIVTVLVIIGILLFNPFSLQKSVVLAEVQEKMEQIHTVQHRETRTFSFIDEDEPVVEADVIKYGSAEYGVVEEQYDKDGNLMHKVYILKKEKQFIMILPWAKKYIKYPLTDDSLALLDNLTPKGLVDLFLSDGYDKLERSTFDGYEVEGYEMQNPSVVEIFMDQHLGYFAPYEQSTWRFWVDVESEFPVGVEVEAHLGSGLLTCFKPMILRASAYDLQWDVEIDPALFEPDIPDDYMEIPIPNPDQVKAIVPLLLIGGFAITRKYKKRQIKK